MVSVIALRDGRVGKVVLVGGRDNPRGAVMVMPGEGTAGAQAVPLNEHRGLLHPRQVVEVLCAQERAFGSSGLNPIETP